MVIPDSLCLRLKTMWLLCWEEEVTWDKVTISVDGCIIFDADMDNLVLVVGGFDRTTPALNTNSRLYPLWTFITFV